MPRLESSLASEQIHIRDNKKVGGVTVWTGSERRGIKKRPNRCSSTKANGKKDRFWRHHGLRNQGCCPPPTAV